MLLPANKALKARVSADCCSGPWLGTAVGRWSDIRAWMSVGDGERDDVSVGDGLATCPACGAANRNGSSKGGSTARASSTPMPSARLLPVVMHAERQRSRVPGRHQAGALHPVLQEEMEDCLAFLLSIKTSGSSHPGQNPGHDKTTGTRIPAPGHNCGLDPIALVNRARHTAMRQIQWSWRQQGHLTPSCRGVQRPDHHPSPHRSGGRL